METTLWITSIATAVIAISTIVYVIITYKTLTSIKSQLKVTEKQLSENVRTTSLIIQPFLSITNVTINLLTPKDIQNIGAFFEGYHGTISISFKITNTGLGPAQNIQVASFLIAKVDEKIHFMGLFPKMVPSLQQQHKLVVTCDDIKNMSHTFISLTGGKGAKLKSFSLAVFQLFQDVSSQQHIQYQVFSKEPEVLKEKLTQRAEIAREIFDFLKEKATSTILTNQMSGEDYALCVAADRREEERQTFVSVDKLNKIALTNVDTISTMVLPDEKIELTDRYDTSMLISQGLPDPLEVKKSFESTKSQLILGSCKSEKEAIDLIIKRLSEGIEKEEIWGYGRLRKSRPLTHLPENNDKEGNQP